MRKSDLITKQTILLTKLRVKKMLKDGIKEVANYDSSKIETPTMAQINRWKHESRKQY